MSEEAMLGGPTAEEPAPPPLITVTVTAPLWEDGKNYRPGEPLETTESRARRLVELGLAAWPPDPHQPPLLVEFLEQS